MNYDEIKSIDVALSLMSTTFRSSLITDEGVALVELAASRGGERRWARTQYGPVETQVVYLDRRTLWFDNCPADAITVQAIACVPAAARSMGAVDFRVTVRASLKLALTLGSPVENFAFHCVDGVALCLRLLNALAFRAPNQTRVVLDLSDEDCRALVLAKKNAPPAYCAAVLKAPTRSAVRVQQREDDDDEG